MVLTNNYSFFIGIYQALSCYQYFAHHGYEDDSCCREALGNQTCDDEEKYCAVVVYYIV